MAPPAKPSITGRKVEEAEPKPKPNRMPATSSRAMKMGSYQIKHIQKQGSSHYSDYYQPPKSGLFEGWHYQSQRGSRQHDSGTISQYDIVPFMRQLLDKESQNGTDNGGTTKSWLNEIVQHYLYTFVIPVLVSSFLFRFQKSRASFTHPSATVPVPMPKPCESPS